MSSSESKKEKEVKKVDKLEDTKKLEVQSVEEDDEFEEFPVQDWQAKEGADDDEELNVWEDNWDDEAHENDFAQQLREELEKHGHKAAS